MKKLSLLDKNIKDIFNLPQVLSKTGLVFWALKRLLEVDYVRTFNRGLIHSFLGSVRCMPRCLGPAEQFGREFGRDKGSVVHHHFLQGMIIAALVFQFDVHKEIQIGSKILIRMVKSSVKHSPGRGLVTILIKKTLVRDLTVRKEGETRTIHCVHNLSVLLLPWLDVE